MIECLDANRLRGEYQGNLVSSVENNLRELSNPVVSLEPEALCGTMVLTLIISWRGVSTVVLTLVISIFFLARSVDGGRAR